MRKIPLKLKIESKITRCWKRNVFTRNDFKDLGGYDQIGRALLELTKEAKLVRIAYGLYAKARPNRLTGKVMLNKGFIEIAREALDVLKVKWELSEAEQRYNANLTTQIPINPSVAIKSRFNRKIATEDGFKLKIS